MKKKRTKPIPITTKAINDMTALRLKRLSRRVIYRKPHWFRVRSKIACRRINDSKTNVDFKGFSTTNLL